jgi:hypothetical protein
MVNMMNKISLILFLLISSVYSNDKGVKCLVLTNENSIICKYKQERSNENRDVVFNWIDPNNDLSRSRSILIPAGHGSVYDFRYIQGRVLGDWTVEVIDNNISYKTTFTLQ